MSTPEDAPALVGDLPVAIVTGSNTGIGFHIAGQLARKGYSVVMACRSMEKGEQAVLDMKQIYGSNILVSVERIDLASVQSVVRFATAFKEKHKSLKLLVCNAGLNKDSIPKDTKPLTDDGVELVYQANYLSHFLLTLMLLPVLQETKDARVINLSSGVHRSAKAEWLDDTRRESGADNGMYSFSKVAQLSSCFELHRRFTDKTGVAFHAVNPGGVASDIWRGYPGWIQSVFNCVLIKPDAAGATVVAACEIPEGNAPAEPKYWNGYKCAACCQAAELWSPCAARDQPSASTPSALARDPAFAHKLWDESIAGLRAAGIQVSLDGVVS